MPLSNVVQTVAIQSVRFPSAFLRMDGSNVTQFQGEGSGTVNCQFYERGTLPNSSDPGNYEVFNLFPIPGAPSGGFAIYSANFRSAFLRIDGSNVTQFQAGGSGTINCQYYNSPWMYPTVGDYEFLILTQVIVRNLPQDVYYIRSGPFQNVFLRIDGSSVSQSQGGGSGTVNCQYYSSGTSPESDQDDELFYIIPLIQTGR
jgi:phospholipase C